MDDLLFRTHDMAMQIREYPVRINRDVRDLPESQVLATSEEDLVSFFVEKYKLDTPTLRSEDTQWLEDGDAKLPAQYRSHGDYGFGGDSPMINGQYVVVGVPFDGDAMLFQWSPSSFALNLPRAKVQGNLLRITVRDTALTAEKVRGEVDRIITFVNQLLSTMRTHAEEWMQRLPSIARSAVQSRRTELLGRRQLAASLGYKMTVRTDPVGSLIVPMKRKVITAQLPPVSTPAFAPEPALSTEQFEEIMRLIDRFAIAIERSPGAFRNSDEEDLRSHIIVSLNGSFEGASAETFNAAGKTDILVRAGDRNVFIAECKIWRGAKQLLAAIDQLLSYSTWRDTRASLIVFNRNKDFSAVLAEMTKTMVTHNHFKRADKVISETHQRFVFRQPGDFNREILVAVTAFDVPK